MYCSWIKAYDAPVGGNRLNPMFLHEGDTVYLDISGIPAGYDFLGWKDPDGNPPSAPFFESGEPCS